MDQSKRRLWFVSILFVSIIICITIGGYYMYLGGVAKRNLQNLSRVINEESLSSGESIEKILGDAMLHLETQQITYASVIDALVSDSTSHRGRSELLKLLVMDGTDESFMHLFRVMLECDAKYAQAIVIPGASLTNSADKTEMLNEYLVESLQLTHELDTVVRIIDIISQAGPIDKSYLVLDAIAERIDEWPEIKSKWDLAAVQLSSRDKGLRVYRTLKKSTKSTDLQNLAARRLSKFEGMVEHEKDESLGDENNGIIEYKLYEGENAGYH